LSENPDNIEYYSDPYEKLVEIVILNTCSFISSGREEMFQTMEKLLSKKKKICIIGCGVQYFEKLLKNKNVISNECEKSIGIKCSGSSRPSGSG
jgi:tRNA A37 methylthiotransferase MiaB